MKERPILFSGPMVRAILEGKKMQTRRVIKPQPANGWKVWGQNPFGHWWLCDAGTWPDTGDHLSGPIRCPYGMPGDRLWVRETHTWITLAENEYKGIGDQRQCPDGIPVLMLYRADSIEIPARWRPSIHMPRWASRLTLEMTGVRMERLQDITEDDIIAEGISLIKGKGWYNPVDNRCYPCAEWAFQYLWNSINAKRGFGWDVNLWVWIIEFGKV